MIIFLDLTNQISEGTNSFAFYHSVNDRILSFDGINVFDSVEEFTEAWHEWLREYNKSGTFKTEQIEQIEMYNLEKLLGLIPERFFQKKRIGLKLKIIYQPELDISDLVGKICVLTEIGLELEKYYDSELIHITQYDKAFMLYNFILNEGVKLMFVNEIPYKNAGHTFFCLKSIGKYSDGHYYWFTLDQLMICHK